MSRTLFAAVLILASMVIDPVPAIANSILYTQATATPTPSVRSSADQAPFGTIEFQTFDSFTLAQTSTIQSISWQGSYFNNFVTNGSFAPPANASGFAVLLYSNSGSPGIPSTLLAGSVVVNPAGANQTFNRQESFVLTPTLGLAIYDYNVTLPLPVVALAGTTYWLSIYALSPPATPTEAQWGWNGGTGGDGSSRQEASGGGSFVVAADRAFTLNGEIAAVPSTVPEPSSLLLLGTGLFAVRRVRQAAKRVWSSL